MKGFDFCFNFSEQSMRENSENQICSSLSSLLCSIFSSLPSPVLFSLTIMLLSTTLLYKFTKKKSTGFEREQEEEEEEEEEEEQVDENFDNPELENEIFKPQNVIKFDQINDYMLPKLSDLSSETESGDTSFSSEDSDRDWSFRNDLGQFQMFSDDSISDDDSLIEIELPGGHYIGATEEPDFKFGNHYIGSKEQQQLKPKFKFQDLFKEPIFGEEDLLELLRDINEMNEEENLIEIDISMGLIKCSRLQIAA